VHDLLKHCLRPAGLGVRPADPRPFHGRKRNLNDEPGKDLREPRPPRSIAEPVAGQ
jgi:hypothetical protein